jgi:hypothetical protein
LLLFLTSAVIISFFLPPSFSTLFFIGAIVVVQLIKYSYYIWTYNKKTLYAHTSDHSARTMLTIRMRYAGWDRIREDYPQSRAACDHVTLGRHSTRIARHRSYIKLTFIKNFCSSCKTLAN